MCSRIGICTACTNISLNFNDDYNSLTGGGGHRDLDGVDVRRHSALKATSILAGYKPHGSTSDADLQTALALSS